MFGIPVKLLAYLGAALVVIAAVWMVAGWHRDSLKLHATEAQLLALQRDYAAGQAKLRVVMQADSKHADDLTDRLARERAAVLALSAAFDRAPLIKEVTHEGSCPTTRLSDPFRVCVNAAVSGDPAAAASCAAAGGHGS
jgi:hypothetical protein